MAQLLSQSKVIKAPKKDINMKKILIIVALTGMTLEAASTHSAKFPTSKKKKAPHIDGKITNTGRYPAKIELMNVYSILPLSEVPPKPYFIIQPGEDLIINTDLIHSYYKQWGLEGLEWSVLGKRVIATATPMAGEGLAQGRVAHFSFPLNPTYQLHGEITGC